MILLLKASLIVIFLLSFYKLFLERESFFKANRLYLIACLILACALPFIVLPKIIQHQGYVDNLYESVIQVNIPGDPLSYTLEPNIDINKEKQKLEDESLENPDNGIDKLSIYSTPSQVDLNENEPIHGINKSESKSWVFWLFCLYLFGVIVLIINLIGQIFNVVLKIIRNRDKIEDEGVVIVNLEGEVEPCSFFNYIFINPRSYDFDTYEQIIAHERVHVEKRHTIDLLFSEIAIIILWFNPFVWILRREIEKNIEYQTDETLLNLEDGMKETYQLNLVKIACNTSPLTITTNYNQSLIKQRIIKMNAKRSNQFNYWKYAFSMPLVFALLLILNRPFEGTSQENGLLDNIVLEHILVNSKEKSELSNNVVNSSKLEIEAQNTPKEVDEKVKKTNFSKQPQVLSSNLIADCEEFEKAVANGDLELVKRILKTLDPDCLKVKRKDGNNLNSVEKMVKEKKKELYEKSEKITDSESSSCAMLRKARDASNELEVRNILMNEDISCMQDIYGNPAKDLSLIKDLLNYGAYVNIDRRGVITISSIGFYIDIYDPDADGCDDPNYKILVEAIKSQNDEEIYAILSGDLLNCPLNEDGKTNDFIFMKKIMKFNPRIVNHNGTAITVKGIGFVIDLDKYIHRPDHFGVAYDEDPQAYYQRASILDDIQNRLDEIADNPDNASCLNLIDAVTMGNVELVEKFLKQMDTECFHRQTTTVTMNDKPFSVSKVTTPLKEAIRMRNVDLIQLILDQNADLNYAGYGKETPLIVAVKTGNTEIVKILVDNGADLNRKDNEKMTALDYAKYKNMDEIFRYLKSNGAK